MIKMSHGIIKKDEEGHKKILSNGAIVYVGSKQQAISI